MRRVCSRHRGIRPTVQKAKTPRQRERGLVVPYIGSPVFPAEMKFGHIIRVIPHGDLPEHLTEYAVRFPFIKRSDGVTLSREGEGASCEIINLRRSNAVP